MKKIYIILCFISCYAYSDKIYLQDGTVKEIIFFEYINDKFIFIDKTDKNNFFVKTYNDLEKETETFTVEYKDGELILNKNFSLYIYREIYKTLIYNENKEDLLEKFSLMKIKIGEERKKILNNLNQNNLSIHILKFTSDDFNSLFEIDNKIDKETILTNYAVFHDNKVYKSGQFFNLSDIKKIVEKDSQIYVDLQNSFFKCKLKYEFKKNDDKIELQSGYLIKNDVEYKFWSKEQRAENK